MIAWLRKHYYWIIVAVMMLVFCAYGGLANNNSSIFIIPVTKDLGMSRADFSLATSVRSMTLFIFMSFSSIAFQRFGVKKPILAGLGLMMLGYALLSISNTVLSMAIVCSLLGIGEAFCGSTAGSRIASNWFQRSRGTVFGIISSCTGLGGAILSVVLSNFIETNGWRYARLLSAAILLVTIIIAAILLYDTPSDIGIAPYGEGYVPKQKKHHRDDAHWMGLSFKELCRRPTFYIAILAFFLSGVCIYSAFSNIAPHLQDQGLSTSDAALQNSLMLVYLAVFKILCGALSDIIGPKWVCALCMVFVAVGLLLLPGVNTVTGAFVAVFIYSVGVPMVLVMIPLVSYPLFGYQSHNETLGIFLALPYLGSLVIVPIANAIYDKTGSYTLIFQICAVLSVVVLGLLLLLYILAQNDQKKFMQTNHQASCDIEM